MLMFWKNARRLRIPGRQGRPSPKEPSAKIGRCRGPSRYTGRNARWIGPRCSGSSTTRPIQPQRPGPNSVSCCRENPYGVTASFITVKNTSRLKSTCRVWMQGAAKRRAADSIRTVEMVPNETLRLFPVSEVPDAGHESYRIRGSRTAERFQVAAPGPRRNPGSCLLQRNIHFPGQRILDCGRGGSMAAAACRWTARTATTKLRELKSGARRETAVSDHKNPEERAHADAAHRGQKRNHRRN